jgi:hypothetical protein
MKLKALIGKKTRDKTNDQWGKIFIWNMLDKMLMCIKIVILKE